MKNNEIKHVSSISLLFEGIEDEYPYKNIDGERFRRSNQTNLEDTFTVQFPAFELTYDVGEGIQFQNKRSGVFYSDSDGRLSLSRGESERIQKLIDTTFADACKDAGFSCYVGQGTYVSLPSGIDVHNTTNESLNEEITEEDIDAFIETIDWKGLNDHISDLLGTKINLKLISRGARDSRYLKVEDDRNLASECGIMAPVYEFVNVHLFNSSVSVDRETGELFYWCSPHFHFEYRSGGSNGTEICYATFKDGKWKFNDRAIKGR